MRSRAGDVAGLGVSAGCAVYCARHGYVAGAIGCGLVALLFALALWAPWRADAPRIEGDWLDRVRFPEQGSRADVCTTDREGR